MQPQHLPSFSLRTLLVACALAVVSLLYLPLPILPQLAQTHGLGSAAAGVISAFGLAYASGFLIFGPLSDRLGRRRVMVCGLMALALVTALLAAAKSAPLLLADPQLRRVYAPALLLLMCFVAFYLVLGARLGPALQAQGLSGVGQAHYARIADSMAVQSVMGPDYAWLAIMLHRASATRNKSLQ